MFEDGGLGNRSEPEEAVALQESDVGGQGDVEGTGSQNMALEDVSGEAGKARFCFRLSLAEGAARMTELGKAVMMVGAPDIYLPVSIRV